MNTIVKECFEPLKTLPCWNVKQGYGSFLTFEFGQPHLEITELKDRRSRTITVHGDWHLWIYCCHWVIEEEGQTLANSDSEREEINQALQKIDGRLLREINIGSKFGCSEFKFEWGAELKTEPYEHANKQGAPYESWMLFEPHGYVLTYRSDETYAHQQSNEINEIWHSDDDQSANIDRALNVVDTHSDEAY